MSLSKIEYLSKILGLEMEIERLKSIGNSNSSLERDDASDRLKEFVDGISSMYLNESDKERLTSMAHNYLSKLDDSQRESLYESIYPVVSFFGGVLFATYGKIFLGKLGDYRDDALEELSEYVVGKLKEVESSDGKIYKMLPKSNNP